MAEAADILVANDLLPITYLYLYPAIVIWRIFGTEDKNWSIKSIMIRF